MPKIYLSPSTQQGNPYVTGGGSVKCGMPIGAESTDNHKKLVEHSFYHTA